MFADIFSALKSPWVWLYPGWVTFLVKYRETYLGPIWIIVGPSLFILVLGTLFGSVMGHKPETFVPHLAVGLIIWGYINSIASASSRLYLRSRAALMQGSINHMNLVMRMICNATIVFLHQATIILFVLVYYRIYPTTQIFYLIPAIALIFIHSIWILTVFGIIGARYRDLADILEMVMRIAFLATPIIWIAGETGRGSTVGKYLLLNPFYHVIEPFRGSLLGTPIDPMSWVISSVIAAVGMLIAAHFYKRFRHLVVLWI